MIFDYNFLISFLVFIIFLICFVLLLVFYKIGFFHVLLLKKVDENCENHGGEIVAEVLKAHGINFLFTLTGGHISPILVACEKIGIKVVDTRHEATAVFAADAVSRLSQHIGVAAVTAGPGVTNTITAVKNAQMAESPLLLIGGSAATLLKGKGALQDIDQQVLLKPLCKYVASVSCIRQIPYILTHAIHVARSNTPGPVFVEFSIDTLYPYKVVKNELKLNASAKKSFFQKVIEFYLRIHLDNIFAGAFHTTPLHIEPIPPSLKLASNNQIQKCVELISKSKQPVLLLGSQVMLPPTLPSQLKAYVEKLSMPCFLGSMSRGLLGRNCRFQLRHCRKDALKQADLVILAGTVCDFRLGYGRTINRKAKVIIINRSKEQLNLNSGIFWNATISLNCDVASALGMLLDNLPGYQASEEWIQSLRDKDNAKDALNIKMSEEPTDKFLNPIMVLRKLENILGDKSILVMDGGDFVGTAAYVLRPRAALSWLDPGAFGTLGSGGGFALGAKLCMPDHDVWVVYGDGSLGFSVAEFDTFARHKIPVVALVGNDACWTQIVRDQVRILGSPVACQLAFCSYELVAKGYGGEGKLLDQMNNVDQVLAEGLDKARNGIPFLINCLIGRTSFREGSISV